MKKIWVLSYMVITLLGCAGLAGSCSENDVYNLTLQDKVCANGAQTCTKIREEVLNNVGLHTKMRFNTLDKVYLFNDIQITIYNYNTNTYTKIRPPDYDKKDYTMIYQNLSQNNQAAMLVIYNFKNDLSRYYRTIFYIDENNQFSEIILPKDILDIAPVEDWQVRPFFYKDYLYLAIYRIDSQFNKIIDPYLLRYKHLPTIEYIEKKSLDYAWGGNYFISQDTLLWGSDISNRIDASHAIFSYDNISITYYGPKGVNYDTGSFFVINKDILFIGYESGIVYQLKEGAWIKHNIANESDHSYSVGRAMWASAPDNVFVAGTRDILRKNNFAYHYDGQCWTRFYKHSGNYNLEDIWGTPDGSVVLAIDDEGNLMRLVVER